jgi:hypothetical protein
MRGPAEILRAGAGAIRSNSQPVKSNKYVVRTAEEILSITADVAVLAFGVYTVVKFCINLTKTNHK